MSLETIEQEIIRILRLTALAGSDREIGPQDPLGELGLGLDSLALVEFVTELEKRFRIEIPDRIWTERGQLAIHHFVEAVAEAALPSVLAELDRAPAPGRAKAEEPSTLPGRSADGSRGLKQKRKRSPLATWLVRLRRFLYNQESFVALDFESPAEPPPPHPSPLGLQVREASLADAEALTAFWRAFHYETIDDRAMTLELFQERQASGSACLAAWHEGRIVAVDWLFKEEYHCPFTGLLISWPDDACYGGELYEHPEYHGKGVGLELLAYSLAMTRKRGFRRQVTLVSAGNAKMLGASVQFYGLKAIGEIHTRRMFHRPFSTWRVGERSGRGGKITL